MPRSALLLPLLLLHAAAFAAEEPKKSQKEQILTAKQLSSAALAAARQGHGLIEVQQPGIPFGSVRGYDKKTVSAKVREIQTNLVGALNRDDLVGLRAYAQEFFPKASLHTFDVPKAADTKCSVMPCPAELADPESVEQLFGYVHQFVDKVSAASAYKVSFRVRSKPSGAKFSLQPLGGGFQTQVATDGPVGNLFRGLYRYTVERDGFKKVEATLNLVDNTPDELYCELMEVRASGSPMPCLFGLIE